MFLSTFCQLFCQLSYSMFEICEKATTIRYSIGWKEIRKNNENNSKDDDVDRLLPKSMIIIYSRRLPTYGLPTQMFKIPKNSKVLRRYRYHFEWFSKLILLNNKNWSQIDLGIKYRNCRNLIYILV